MADDPDQSNPSTQLGVTKFLGVFNSIAGFGIGVCLLAVPSPLLNLVFHHHHHTNNNHSNTDETKSLELTLARLAGGLILCLSFTSLSLVIVSNAEQVTPLRLALSSQAAMGLLLVVVGLLDDRLNPTDDVVEYAYLLGCGALFLIVSCIGMTASFWPRPHIATGQIRESEADQRRFTGSCCSRRRDDRDELLLEPLLNEGNDDEAPPAPSGDAADDGIVQETGSRIQGTKRLIKLAAPQMSYLYIGCIVLLIRLPFSLSIPHFVSTTLAALGRGDYQQAKMEILLLFVLGSIDAVFDFWCVFLFGYAKERIVRGVRMDLFSAILRQDVAFFDRHTSGDLSSRLSSDCGEMAGDLTWFFRFSIESVVRISGIAVYMLIRCPSLGGCALSIVPVVAVLNKAYGNWLGKNAILVQSALAEANSVAQEAFACVRTVIAFAAEDAEHAKYSNRIDQHYRLNILQLIMTGLYYMTVSTFLINTVVQSALLLVGTLFIQDGRLTSEILLAFMLYQGQLQNETMNLFNSYSSLVKSSGAGDKVFELLDRMPPPPGTGSSVVVAGERRHSADRDESGEETDGNDRTRRSHCSVAIQNVGFVYPTRPTHPVLKGLTLTIPAGSTTALVGSSGCGKSTIVSLLKRFYDPSSGAILVDDVDLCSIDVKDHRRRVGVVTQDPVLFSGSIMSNITYGCPDAAREDAVEAAQLANAHAFITSFPDGYDTEVGERGVALSGGQKQRIAIARAIVKRPSLLLLDEATSALDAESETVVQDALDRLMGHRDMTTVVVAHRLRTVHNADCIAYIHDGVVVERGTHEELMRLGGDSSSEGYYRRMVERAGTSGQLPLGE